MFRAGVSTISRWKSCKHGSFLFTSRRVHFVRDYISEEDARRVTKGVERYRHGCRLAVWACTRRRIFCMLTQMDTHIPLLCVGGVGRRVTLEVLWLTRALNTTVKTSHRGSGSVYTKQRHGWCCTVLISSLLESKPYFPLSNFYELALVWEIYTSRTACLLLTQLFSSAK